MKPVEYPEECMGTVKAANRLGYDCTLRQAEELWEVYAYRSPTWISQTDADIIEAVKRYFGGNG